LSFLLLVGAGLLIRSFTQLMSVDRGFQTDKRLVFALSMLQRRLDKRKAARKAQEAQLGDAHWRGGW